MTDIIVAALLLLIIGAAAAYVIKAKKSGSACIGCPAAANCRRMKQPNTDSCTCGCHTDI